MSKFLDVRFLTRDQSQGHDTANMHVGAVYVHVQLELLTDCLDVFQSLLEIGTCTTDPDGGLVFD